MNCIIIDDETTARVIMNQLCSQVDGLTILEEFPNAIQAIKYLNQNGFDFIQTLKNPPKIILTTSDANFAIEAFEYDCIVDYLVKPIHFARFEKAIQKARNATISENPSTQSTPDQEATSDNHLYINIDRRLIKLEIPSIYLIEAKGDYINVKTEDKNYTVHSTLLT